MLNNHVSGASGNWRIAPFLFPNSQVTEESPGRVQMAPATFQLLRRRSASIVG